MFDLFLGAVLGLTMLIVQKIRRDPFNYLSAPEDLLSDIRRGYIAKLAHGIPSLIIPILIAIKIIPLMSDDYAEQLSKNSIIITITIILLFIPVLIVIGFLIEIILEVINSDYRKAKKSS